MKKRFSKYQLLMRLYPAAYRKEYGDQMVQTLSDMLEDTHSALERRLVWARVILDLPFSITKAQLQYAESAFHNDTPDYIKLTGLLTSLLVLPFILALSADGLDKVMYDHTLYDSWLWRMPALGVWVLWFPGLALLLAIVGYLNFTVRSISKHKATRLYSLLDVVHTWPIIIPGIIAFGILFILAFHDSAHCWVQDPVYFVTKFHQTLQCTQHGFFGG